MPTPSDMPRRRPTVAQPEGWHLSQHAYLRAVELGYRTEEVLACAEAPATTYDSDDKRYGKGQKVHKRGDIAIVTNPRTHEVVTVLLPKTDQWTHGKDRRQP